MAAMKIIGAECPRRGLNPQEPLSRLTSFQNWSVFRFRHGGSTNEAGISAELMRVPASSIEFLVAIG